MIPLDAAGIFAAALLLFLAPVFLVWIGFEMGRAKSQRRAQRGLAQCRLCGTTYPCAARRGIEACPSCGALNELNEPQFF
ncbi:MAG: hypothetical protein N2322_02190 [Terrimicrobiaceae bacterium]|nr:hypothetical protein [Terrimicrobiaceae bacterium]